MSRTRRKTVYLANHYGFSAQQRDLLLPPLIAALEALGLEVWEPFERNNQIESRPIRLGLSHRPSRLPRRAGGGRTICRRERRAAG